MSRFYNMETQEYDSTFYYDHDYLNHSGILGMKWGQRRYQYEDGSLTPEGRERYGVGEKRSGGLVNKVASGIANTKANHKAKVTKKKRTKALEKARKSKAKKAEEAKKAKEAEDARQKDMKSKYLSDNARKTFQNMDKMSDQELQAAANRIANEQRIRDAAMKEIEADRKANPSNYQKAMNVLKQVNDITATLAPIATNTKKITDAFGLTKSDGNKDNPKAAAKAAIELQKSLAQLQTNRATAKQQEEKAKQEQINTKSKQRDFDNYTPPEPPAPKQQNQNESQQQQPKSPTPPTQSKQPKQKKNSQPQVSIPSFANNGYFDANESKAFDNFVDTYSTYDFGSDADAEEYGSFYLHQLGF